MFSIIRSVQSGGQFVIGSISMMGGGGGWVVSRRRHHHPARALRCPLLVLGRAVVCNPWVCQRFSDRKAGVHVDPKQALKNVDGVRR